MNELKINLKNEEKVREAIERAEKKCSARLLSISQIESFVKDAEKKLKQLGITKKFWQGIKIQIMPERVAMSYTYIPEGTTARLQYFSSGWFLVDVWRARCGCCANGSYQRAELTLTAEAKASIPTIFDI